MHDSGDHTIGPLLRVLRQQAGRSQSEQADVLSDLAGRSVTRNEVSRWESERRLLTPFWQNHYAASFHVPVDVLRRAIGTTKAQRRRCRGEDDPVHRREFLGVLASLTAPTGRPVEPSPGKRIGASDVEHLFQQMARLRRLDDLLGGADTYQIYAAQTAETEHLLANARFAGKVGRQLRSLLGEQHQMAGWAAFDAGHHTQARKHYVASLTAAKEADNPVLAGNALAFVAYQETATTGDGTTTAQASHDMAGKVATPRVEALLLERKAFAHAVAGDAQLADTALAQSRDALHRIDARPEPDWVFWVDEQEIDIMAGRCWTELRRPLRAVPVLERVLSGFDDTHARDKALYLTWLASSYLQAREIEQAAATLTRAHNLAIGVASVRPTARITGVARRLARYRGVPEVSATLDRIGV